MDCVCWGGVLASVHGGVPNFAVFCRLGESNREFITTDYLTKNSIETIS